MEITYTYATNDDELEQILALQTSNHYSQITKDTKEKEGFVTVKHDLELLKTIQGNYKHSIAKFENKVVGYALMMIKEEGNKIKELFSMFEILDNLSFKGVQLDKYNYFVMGQVCIDKDYRSHGIFDNLYLNLRKQTFKKYSLLVTEISTSNLRSLRAHTRVGFVPIHQYTDELDEWVVVAWEL
jgi:hypothetical protein